MALKFLEEIEKYTKEVESHNVIQRIEQLQRNFQEKGANLFLKGKGREPTSDEIGRLLPAGKLPIGSDEILPLLENALEQSDT
jgi:hypothetical protein